MSEKAEKNGVKVVIFSSMNPAGERLKQMTGVAAILRFPLAGLDDVEEPDDSSTDSDQAKGDDSSSDESKASSATTFEEE